VSEAQDACLTLENITPTFAPVLLAEQRIGTHLKLDITPSPAIRRRLELGYRFRLLRHRRGVPFRTPPLIADAVHARTSEILCHCAYPTHLELFERRQALRVEVSPGGPAVGVILHAARAGSTAHGRLKDLSVSGCLVELDAEYAPAFQHKSVIEIEFWFPNGQRFEFQGCAKRWGASGEPAAVAIGFQFVSVDPGQIRQLQALGHGLALEGERHSSPVPEQVPRSKLFRPARSGSAPRAAAQRSAQAHRQAPHAAIFNRLVPLADALNAQLVAVGCVVAR
jgi:hypothetical protein